MLDTRRAPDICDLGTMCRQYLDIAEILCEHACSVNMPKDEAERRQTDRLVSVVSKLTDMIREISAVASVLDGFDKPERYGFPTEATK